MPVSAPLPRGRRRAVTRCRALSASGHTPDEGTQRRDQLPHCRARGDKQSDTEEFEHDQKDADDDDLDRLQRAAGSEVKNHVCRFVMPRAKPTAETGW